MLSPFNSLILCLPMSNSLSVTSLPNTFHRQSHNTSAEMTWFPCCRTMKIRIHQVHHFLAGSSVAKCKCAARLRIKTITFLSFFLPFPNRDLHQRRRAQPIGSEIHRHGRAGKPNCDAAPPLRPGACHQRSAIYFRNTSTLRACGRPRVPCLAILLPLGCLLLHCRHLPHLPLLLALHKQKLRSRSETSWSTWGLSLRSLARVEPGTKPARFTRGIKIPRVAS